MSLYIVDIHGEIEGDYEIVRKYKEQESILDKVRAEIMDTGAYEQEVNGNTEFLKGINYCLSVIDKYRELEKGVL